MKKKALSFTLAIVVLISSMLMPFLAFSKSSTPVWDKYSKKGSYKVSTLTFTVDGYDFTYKAWYPSNISSLSKRPVILYCNGTGSNYENTPDTENYLTIAASHGYVCISNTDQNTGTGASMDAGMTELIKLNKTSGHKFYNKIDINKVGLAGHSQGATCTINLASKGKYANLKHYKAIYACSLPSPELAESQFQNCPYNASLVSLPTLMTAGTGITDSTFISPMDRSLSPAMKKIKSDVYLARMTNIEHADSIGKTFPYMIAWFDYKLLKNENASKAFIGKSPELETNKKWQDFKVKIYFTKAKLSKVKAGKKSFKATWTKQSGVSGYQLQYSTSSKFSKKSTKSVLVKKSSTTSKTVKKLKAKKKYYVRIRPYRSIGGVKYYGKWTAAKNVKTKK